MPDKWNLYIFIRSRNGFIGQLPQLRLALSTIVLRNVLITLGEQEGLEVIETFSGPLSFLKVEACLFFLLYVTCSQVSEIRVCISIHLLKTLLSFLRCKLFWDQRHRHGNAYSY